MNVSRSAADNRLLILLLCGPLRLPEWICNVSESVIEPASSNVSNPVLSKDAPAAPKGRLFVISGPSGVGKDALLGRLYQCLPNIKQSVSATTRAPRPGETDGTDYHFFSHAQFESDIRNGYFLEHARYGTDYYGTPRGKVDDLRRLGIDVVLKIEVQGAAQIKELVPDAVLVFIKPPSLAELERRLRSRGTDTEQKIMDRLAIAQYELAQLFLYDYMVTNDDFDTALKVLCGIVAAERERAGK